MNSDKKAHKVQEDDQFHKLDQNIEWDNGEATYGHSISDAAFKKKNTPDESHLAKMQENDIDVNKNLKNINLSTAEDPAKRNGDQEKGLGGKNL